MFRKWYKICTRTTIIKLHHTTIVSGMNVTFNEDPSTIDNTGPGTTFPTNCTGKFNSKNTMSGTFKNGPDTGTWTASRKLVFKKIPVRKK